MFEVFEIAVLMNRDKSTNSLPPFFCFSKYYSFLLVQKRNKKAHPETMTARFRDSSLIKLLCYCGEELW
jgi:hypothetical protein